MYLSKQAIVAKRFRSAEIYTFIKYSWRTTIFNMLPDSKQRLDGNNILNRQSLSPMAEKNVHAQIPIHW